MVRNQSSTSGLKELAHLARRQTHEGVLVQARCFAVTDAHAPRYEIVIDGHGQYAVIDVAVEDEIPQCMDLAMASFAAAARARARAY